MDPMTDRQPITERITLMLTWGVALVVLWGAAHINVNYLEKIPHVQDSVNYLFQAQLFAMGKIAIEAPENVSSFASEHIIVQDNRWYCHYPFLVPLLFMFGLKFGATHLVNPIFAMLSILMIYKTGKEFYTPWTGLWAAVFLASSPFFMVMSASFMSHPTGLLLTSIALYLFMRVLKTQKLRTSILLGLTIGLLFNTRPLTAFAVSLPIFSFYIRNRSIFRKKIIKHLVVWSLCSFIGVGAFFFYSSLLSGKTLQFATHTRVSETRGPTHIPIVNRFINSFAAAGVAKKSHTPERGLGCVKALLELYHTYSLNWPHWFNLSLFLIPLIPWRRREEDRFLYWTFLSIPMLYTLYWRSAIMYGPRYIYEILPMTVLLSARGLDVCREAAGWLHKNSFMKTWRTRSAATAIVMLFLYGFTGWLIYSNVDQFFVKSTYSTREYPPVSLVPMKLTAMKNFNGISRRVPDAVAAFDITNAVVFVKDHRWQGFGAVSSFNRPTLDTPVVYAKDINDQINRQVMEHFPERSYYWTPYPRVQLHQLVWDEEQQAMHRIRLMTPEELTKQKELERLAQIEAIKKRQQNASSGK